MLAVLEDGINCFQHNVLAQSGKRKRLFEEAKEWILAGDRDWFFSFENICEVCGINPAYVSQGLLRCKEKKLPKDPDSKYWERKRVAWYKCPTHRFWHHPAHIHSLTHSPHLV